MGDSKFLKLEAIRFGWNTAKANLGFLIGLVIVAGLVVYIPSIVSELAGEKRPVITILFSLVSMFSSIVVSIGMIRISLKLHDNQKARIRDLFDFRSLFLKYIAAAIVYNLIIFAGFLLLIIPGIIWSIKFQFFAYFIVDKGLGPIDALKQSSIITKGAKWDLFLFGLICAGIYMLGVLALLVGLFIAVPTVMVAVAFVYRKLLLQTETPIITTS